MNIINKNIAIGYLYIITTVFLWGSSFIGIKLCINSFSPGSLALFRSLIASCVLAAAFCYSKSYKHKVSKKNIIATMLLGIIGIGLYNFLINFAEQTLPPSTAGFIAGQIPLVSTFLAVFFLKEKTNKYGWLGILISFTGIIIIATFSQTPSALDQSNHNLDISIMVLAIFFAAIYCSLQKPILKEVNPLTFTCYAIWSATAALLYFTPELQHDLHNANSETIKIMIYLGVFPSGIAYITLSKGLNKMPATSVANLIYMMPASTITLSWYILQDKPSSITIAGGLIAILGALINCKYGKN